VTRRKSKSDGVRPVTLQDIADRCGVSRITASCALRRDRKGVSQAVMDRILETANKMGYDPAMGLAARRLKYQHFPEQVENHLVALFFPVFHERYWALIFQGINKVLQNERYGLLLCSAAKSPSKFGESLPYVFRRGEVDGVLVFAQEDNGLIVRGLADEQGFGNRPVVTIAELRPGHAAVVVDDRQVGFLAASHLLELGHRHLMCFHHPGFHSEIISQRVAGHEQAMKDKGMDPAVYLHHAPWVWDDQRGLEPTMKDLLPLHPQVTGLLCPNDNIGIQLARALRALGLRIPKDMSMIGVDDSDEWRDSNDRNIWSTVRLPLEELGAESARLLLKRVRSETPEGTVVTLPVTLVPRGTCCAPRK
jgi:DNA-binding LacI/PurR family transcriptional regulator